MTFPCTVRRKRWRSVEESGSTKDMEREGNRR